MNSSLNEMLKFGTNGVIGLLESLTDDEWFIQPEGFANNIAWNAGHLILVRHNLIYRAAGLDRDLPDDWDGMYKGGTSPADWDQPHKPADLLAEIKKAHAKLQKDIESDLFSKQDYHKFDIRGTPIHSIADGAAFSVWHEGLHLGQMMGIRDVLRK